VPNSQRRLHARLQEWPLDTDLRLGGQKETFRQGRPPRPPQPISQQALDPGFENKIGAGQSSAAEGAGAKTLRPAGARRRSPGAVALSLYEAGTAAAACGEPGCRWYKNSTMALANIGKSLGVREEIRLPSVTTGASIQMAPAFSRSSLMP